ncbi:MAG TPA: glycosyltransferase family 4 protein [Bacteroidia bacterium]|nr:glycosyltransferase family 4 protein [Bacteroidia bacterium]
MKNILFYYPSNRRTIAIESLIIKFHEQGNRLNLLTQSAEGDLHEELKKQGIHTYSHFIEKKNAALYYLKHIIFLAQFCRKNKIDIVYSHLQQANIVAVFAQFLTKSKFFICRHHSDKMRLDYNFNQNLFDKIINRLSKVIIVPSQKVYDEVTRLEKVPPRKVKLIRYGYDFSKYANPDPELVNAIREKYKARLLILKIARLVPSKRHILLFEVLNVLIKKEQMDIKLIAISDGPLMNSLQEYVTSNNLQNNIFILGNQSTVMNYLQAADAIIHVSESEASNNLIKEAALLKKCVLVCKDVGDFNEYIQQDHNGILLDKNEPEEDLKNNLKALYHKKLDTSQMGNHLYSTVKSLFSIENVIGSYKEFNQ